MTDERQPPRIDDAPGLVWRPRKKGWAATWQCRSDIAKSGYSPQTARLWSGAEPTEIEKQHIATQCRRLQSDMKLWAQEGEYVYSQTCENLKQLIQLYQTDPDSSFHKKRYAVRKNHHPMLRRMSLHHGEEKLSNIKARLLLAWHKEWSCDGAKLSVAHAFIGHLRTLFGFGATILENEDCERLCGVLHKMRFPQGKPRTVRLTADMVIAHRAKAHWRGWNYMALAQAFQFEFMLRQKDVIGEWVPMSEPGITDVAHPRFGKWLTGLRWEEVGDDMVLRHVTSKRQKEIEVSLLAAPMVMEELADLTGIPADKITRADLPAKGPIIFNEVMGLPYITSEFRRKWRIVADLAGLPAEVRNMDTRAGAITEATEAGADLEHIRHAATHSDISMTQRYSRGATEKIAGVMATRTAHRNKPKT